MSRRLEFGRLRVLKEGGIERAPARPTNISMGSSKAPTTPSCTPCRAGSRRRTVVPADPCAGARTKDLARSSRRDGGCGRAYRERRQWLRRSCDGRRRATVFDGTCLDANRPR